MEQFLTIIGWIFLGIVSALALFGVALHISLNEFAKAKYTDIDRWNFISWLTSWGIPLMTFSRTDVEGLEKLSEEQVKTGVIYANHHSIFDVFALLTALKRRHSYISKIEISKVFFLNRGMQLIRCGFLDRSNPRAAVATVNNAVEIVKEGVLMVVFPEGTREVNAPLGKFKAGSFKIATKAKADIIPMTIYNSQLVGKRWPRPTTVKIKIHDPIAYEVYKNLDTPQIADMVERIVKQDLVMKQTSS